MKVDDTEVIHSAGETILIVGNQIRYIVDMLMPCLDDCNPTAFSISNLTIYVYSFTDRDPYLTVECHRGMTTETIWRGTLGHETRAPLTDVLCEQKVPGDAIEEVLNFKTLIHRCVC